MTNAQNVEEENLPPANDINSDENSENPGDENETQEEKESREESRFKEGQILRFVRVRFPGNSRSFPFLVGKRLIEYGQKVVAMSDRGMAVGYVNSFPYDVPYNKSMLPIRSISKVAIDEDIVKDKEAYRQQKNAENICNDLIEEYQLDMHLTHVEFTSFGKKAVFYFIAPSRVDFRDLVRDLVGRLKTRIELRQISVRDRSASVGGLGPCGRELCCSSFLTKYGNVGIKMAKNQDLTLNFSKLNGVCGQLKCCLQYEDDVYREKRARLPKEGDYITTHTGEMGRVDRLHLLSEQFEILTSKGVRKRYVVEMYKDTLDRETANFPKEFDSVSNETHKVVGLDETAAKKAKAFEAQVKAFKEPAKDYADEVFSALFGAKSLDYSLPEVEEPMSDRPRHVKSIDEEEELSYTPSDDELLPDDENDDFYDGGPIVTQSVREGGREQRHDNQNRPPRDGGGNRSHNNQNRGPRPGPGGGGQNRDQQNRGPRDNNRDNRPRQQGQGQGPSQGQGPGPNQGGPGQGPRPQNNNNPNRSNQGRNRPPR